MRPTDLMHENLCWFSSRGPEIIGKEQNRFEFLKRCPPTTACLPEKRLYVDRGWDYGGGSCEPGEFEVEECDDGTQLPAVVR